MTYLEFTPRNSSRLQVRTFLSADLPDSVVAEALIDASKDCVHSIAKNCATTEAVENGRILSINVVALSEKGYEEALRNAYLQGLRDGRMGR